jgi:type IX secretion system substrate protein
MRILYLYSIVFFEIILIHNFSSAQISFQKGLYGANLHQSIPASDSTSISIGWWNDPLDSLHQYTCLIKASTGGDTIWTKMYGEDYDVIGFSLDTCKLGGFIAGGISYPTDSLGEKVYLIRTDSDGDTLWVKKFGGTGDDGARYVAQTFDSGFIISGVTNSFGAGARDIYIIKTDSNGNIEWSKTFGTINNDISYSIIQTSDSGFVALGILNAWTTNSDMILIKLNSLGDTLWTKQYGGSGSDIGYSIHETFDHNLAIAGATSSFVTSSSAFILITDSIGDKIWAKYYSGTGSTTGTYVSQTSDSGFVLSGYTNSFGASTIASLIIKTNSLGDTIWSKIYNETNTGVAWSVEQTSDGGYITAGEQNELMKLKMNGSTGCFEKNITPSVMNLPISALNLSFNISTPNTASFPTNTVIKSGINIITHCITTGIEHEDKIINSISIFPNPSKGFFTIKFSKFINQGSIVVTDIMGKRIYEDSITNSFESKIDIRNSLTGIYIVKVIDDINYYYKKIIVQ